MKNKFFHRDKKLADRGWAAMRATLDREMPAERRRRRFLWPWWLLLPALLAGGGAGAWFFAKKPGAQPSPAITPETSMPVAAAPGAIRPPATKEQPTPETTSSGPAKARNVLEKPATQTPAGRPAPLTSPAPLPVETERAIPATVEAPKPRNETNRLEDEAIDPRIETPSISPVLLPGLHIRLQPTAVKHPEMTLQQIPAPGEKHNRPHPSPWSFGLTAGVNSRDASGLHGLTAGATADLSLGRKWGLRSGLVYGYERLPQSARIPVSAPAIVQYEVLDQDTSEGNFVIIEDVVAPVNNPYQPDSTGQVVAYVTSVQRLELPLMLWWEPVHRWRLYGGGSLARTFHVKTGGHQFFVDQNQIINGQLTDPQNRLNQLAAREVRAWQTTISGGIGFRPSKHFEFDLFAQNLPATGGQSTENTLSDPSSIPVNAQETASKSSRSWRFHCTATYFF